MLNRPCLFCILLFSLSGVALGQIAQNVDLSPTLAPRVSIDLNPGWKFIRQDISGAEAPAFDDSSWSDLSLPHTWNNLDGEDGGNDYYQGSCWYRRNVNLADQNAAGKSIFIKFDGASIATSVYVNGKSAGPTHKGMFGAFCFDVTKLINPSGDNVIAVRVNNTHDHDVPPISADFTFYGGIYRGVHLLITSPLAISPLDEGSSGVAIRQEKVSAASADLQITTKLLNADQKARRATVTTEIVDDSGKTAWSISSQQDMPVANAADCVQHIVADHPHLWNARKDPYLYYVRVSVSDGTSVVDRVEQPLGIRFYSVDPDKGFILNGQPYPLHGVNRHQDRVDKGWAISPADHLEDFNLIMEMGCTGIRLAHYEHAQEFYNLCDRGGLVVWAEDGIVNEVADTNAFDDSAKQQLRELIKQNENHPSICFWSLFNELRDMGRGTPAAVNKAQLDHQAVLVGQLNELAHQLDPTRMTTAASLRPPEYKPLLMPDILAFNDYYGWYRGKPEDWPGYLDHLRAALPGRAIAISEYGAGASLFEHEFDPRQPITIGSWHPEEWQSHVHEVAYAAMKDRPWLWGTFLWNMFDFGSDGRVEGDHLGINDKGLVSYDRKTKKDAFFFYQANWTTEPMVYITDRRFSPRNISTGPVKIYSNCETVELIINGISLGSKSAMDHIFTWDAIKLARGENTIEAVGTSSGKTVTDQCQIIFDPGFRPMRPFEPATRATTSP